jgi:acyl-CoA reductase-like NAD-dependent aldehyde dehydrogenase
VALAANSGLGGAKALRMYGRRVEARSGGFKESGIGREGGVWGMHEYTEVETIA